MLSTAPAEQDANPKFLHDLPVWTELEFRVNRTIGTLVGDHPDLMSRTPSILRHRLVHDGQWRPVVGRHLEVNLVVNGPGMPAADVFNLNFEE